jgi:CheY-like chemotaxis protein
MPLRVLIVDDDPLSRNRLARALEANGHTVMLHAKGFGTTRLVQTRRPDVVVVDVELPGLPGPQLIEIARRRLREAGEGAVLPLFLLHSAMEAVALDALAASCGAVGGLPKALSPRGLADAFERLVGRGAARVAQTA